MQGEYLRKQSEKGFQMRSKKTTKVAVEDGLILPGSAGSPETLNIQTETLLPSFI